MLAVLLLVITKMNRLMYEILGQFGLKNEIGWKWCPSLMLFYKMRLQRIERILYNHSEMLAVAFWDS